MSAISKNYERDPGPPPRPRRWGAAVSGIALAGLLAVVAYEARLVPRLQNRLAPGLHLWTTAEAAAVAAVRRETRSQLLAARPVPRFGSRPGLRLEEALALGRQPPPVNTWANACLAAGVLAGWEVTGDEADRTALRRFADRVVGLDGGFVEPLTGVEQAMVGPVLLALANGPDGGKYRAAAGRLADFLLKELRRTSTGTLPYGAGRPDVCLVDTLAMACPFLAAAGTKLARPEASELAVRQLLEFGERATDPATGLPWHAYTAGGGAPYGLCGWTRGAGWMAVGLAETLVALPPHHPDRARLVALLDRLAGTTVSAQDQDGTWRWCLTIPEGETDTSGTALLAWAFERGVQIGVLPPERRVNARLAVDGVIRRTDDYGVVGGALGECQAVGQHPRVYGAYPWAQGPLTVAVVWTSPALEGKRTPATGTTP
jgi:unsaturated rhamnogalacturonyl hydrolase